VAQVGFSLPLIGRLKSEFPGVVVGMKDSSGDWSNMQAVLEAHPDLEFFPGSELHLLQGLKAGTAGVISATANVAAKSMRRLWDDWKGGEAERMQSSISALRHAVQAYPVIPLLKAIIAHYRGDNAWANVRPPFTPLPKADAEKAIAALAAEHAFKLDFKS
jgi:4-hydroxy-tetrahydrodipicolinate synthase